MKPAKFDCVRASGLGEVAQYLADANGTARLVAGGQSLGPMLNLRLVQPSLLIDITGIPELTRIEDADDAVTFGACITTANVEDCRFPERGLEPLAAVAAQIAYRAVRNRGTVGGSLCHADPAADWVAALCALGAECMICGGNGSRHVPADQFVTGAYENALAPGEMLDAIKVPRLSQHGRFGYHKICRKAGEFALAIGAVLNDPERGQLRIVIGAVAGRPIVIADARDIMRQDKTLDDKALARVLARHGIVDGIARRWQIAAVMRAYQQAMTP
jgi:aerobic carbon-monoxide dehydrogenase medium subunit